MNSVDLISLHPIVPSYSYHKNEDLTHNNQIYQNGLTVKTFNGFEGYKDISFVKGSCFVLTSAVSMHQIFQNDVDTITNWTFKRGKVFRLSINGSYIESNSNSLRGGNKGSAIYMSPIQSNGTVQLSINGLHFEISPAYPFLCSLVSEEDRADDPTLYNFFPLYDTVTGHICFKVVTAAGYRFLALNSVDQYVRATGLIVDTAIQDYEFTVTDYISEEFFGFSSSNDWGVYYNELDSKTHNKDAMIQTVVNDIPTHMLIDFPLSSALSASEVNINIANLKTNLTPSSGPSSSIL